MFAFLVMGWFLVSTVPALLRFPVPIISMTVIIGVFTRLRLYLPFKPKTESRRYELPTLKTLLPLFACYLLLLFWWPTTLDLHTLQSTYMAGGKSKMFLIFGFLERFAAFTLLGYIIAEMRGRKGESVKKALGWLFIITLPVILLNGLLRGLPPASYIHYATLLELFLMVSAAIYGGLIYRLQLRAIKGIFN